MEHLTIDGGKIKDLETFFDLFGKSVLPENGWWGKNLDGLRDVVNSEDAGLPKDGLVLVIKNWRSFARNLGYEATIKWWDDLMKKGKIAKENEEFVLREIELLKNQKGNTLFHKLINIFIDAKYVDLHLE